MYVSVREALGLSVVDDDREHRLGVGERAVAVAFDYHVDITDEPGAGPRVRLAPRFEGPQGSTPPPVQDVDDGIVAVWRDIAPLLTEPAAVARFRHLLWERRDGDVRGHVTAASDAYVDASRSRGRDLDAVEDLSAALRLARAVGDGQRVGAMLDDLLDLVEGTFDHTGESFGPRIRALQTVVADRDCPDRADELLERCVEATLDASRKTRLLNLAVRRARDDDARRGVRRLQVDAWMAEAEHADSALLRSVRLQQALQQADMSGDPELRERVASAMQSVAGQDLGLATITASSRRFEEDFERLRDAICAGETWQEALVTFARFPPLSGDTDENRDAIRERHRLSPLAAHFPVQLLTPEGLPLYSGTGPEERFDVDLRRWEADLIGAWGPIVAAGLAEIPRRHGQPLLSDLTAFLSCWPGLNATGSSVSLVDAIAGGLLRYWAGDPVGAGFVALPQVESVARHLVLGSGRGVFRLQQQHVPGQFPGLGVLLPIVAEEYGMTESRRRFYETLLVRPAGLNLRNVVLHGYTGSFGSDTAAVILHAILHLVTLHPPEAVAAEADGT